MTLTYRNFSKALPILEALTLTLGYYITVHLFHIKDVFFIKESSSPFLLLLLLLTLFHGLSAGLISLLILIPILEKTYPHFPTDFFIWILLLTLLAGEFHYFWNKKIKQLSEETDYIKGKLRLQTSQLILLKLSHDQLEKHYLIKPVSLRTLLTEVERLLTENRERAIKEFKEILLNTFYVEAGSLYLLKDKKFQPFMHVGEPVEIHLKDPLLQEALERGETLFISNVTETADTEYLAVIPIKKLTKEMESRGVFLLKEMPFNYLNADHVLALSVALNWFFNQLDEEVNYREVPERLRELLSPNMLRELLILEKLSKEANIESSLVVFRVPDTHVDFPNFIEKRIRGMDIVAWFRLNGNIYTLVLLPLSPVESAESFIERIKQDVEETFNEEIFFIHRIFPVDSKIFERINYAIR